MVVPTSPRSPRSPRTKSARARTTSRPAAATGRDLAEDIQNGLDEVMQRHQDFQRNLAHQLGVDAAGLATMEHLLRGGPAGPTEVARRLGISTAATTLVLDRLEGAGHLTRTPHPSDRRKVVLTPAPTSATAAQGYVDPLLRAITDLTDDMDPAEQAVVADFLARLTAAYDRAASDIAPKPPARGRRRAEPQ